VGLARFRHVDLPLLMGQIKLLVVLGFIGGLQGFQTQLLLTNGGPGYATMVPGMHLYQNAMTFDRMAMPALSASRCSQSSWSLPIST